MSLFVYKKKYSFTEQRIVKFKMPVSETINQVTLFSETDSRGVIIFVNEAFCNVSKFKKEELLGKPHNIIRHPDMPKQFFKILWSTITNGDVFRGVIKNRAKDGTHYWVNATIMPVVDNNKNVIKHVSIRYLIEDDKLASTLYDRQRADLELS